MVPPFRIRPAIVLFGDSITQQAFGMDGNVGWASLLASSYTRRADVLNRGFSGYNTNHAVDLLPRVFGTFETTGSPLFCTVFFGANDAALPGEPQHVPIKQYRNNLGTIIDSIRERVDGSKEDFPIILLTPPPVHEEAWKECRELKQSDRRNQVAKEYGDAVKQVGQEHNCPVLDIWQLLDGLSSPDVYKKHLSDGLHLNESGNRRIYDGLMELIQTKYPDLAPMADDDGDGKHGKQGILLEEKLWTELC